MQKIPARTPPKNATVVEDTVMLPVAAWRAPFKVYVRKTPASVVFQVSLHIDKLKYEGKSHTS